MNALNFASAISPNLAGGKDAILPRISIIDIGYSSSGLVSLLQESLPAHRRHEVVFRRLRMDRSNSINVFDTQLGMRRPLAAERQFLINFMNLICANGNQAPSGAMVGLISAAIDQIYDDFSDSREPRPYMPDDESLVDKALDEIGFESNDTTIWWEVVDILMAKGYIYEAEIAQRHAVPTVSDLVSASQSDQIVSLYGETINPETNEPLISSFQRMISEIVRDYPILSSHTRFSVGSSRIVALDLQDVTAKGTGTQALKKTSLMYMVARQVMTRSYFLDECEIISFHERGFMPEIYLDHHVKAARDNMKIPKIICMDEFHRTGKIHAIVDQVIQDAREGRKYNVDIRIASQFIEDFPISMIEVATGLVVCNAGTENSVSYLDKVYGLSENDRHIMRYNLRGPGKNGAPFWLLMRLKEQGEIRQELNLTLGPAEIWAFSTTSEDVALRSRLYELIGPKMARKILSTRFPAGTAKPDIEARVARFEERGERLDDDAREDLIENFAQELAQQAVLLKD
jgi:intracellular multiplication protein IcmB